MSDTTTEEEKNYIRHKIFTRQYYTQGKKYKSVSLKIVVDSRKGVFEDKVSVASLVVRYIKDKLKNDLKSSHYPKSTAKELRAMMKEIALTEKKEGYSDLDLCLSVDSETIVESDKGYADSLSCNPFENIVQPLMFSDLRTLCDRH